MNQGRMRQKTVRGLLVILALCLLCGCQGRKNKGSVDQDAINQPSASTETDNYDTVFTGVVTGYDENKKTLSLYDIKGKMNYVLEYNGGTDIKDAYDQMITIPQIAVGEIVDAYYYEANQKLTALNISKEAWTYNKVGNLLTDKSMMRMKISDHTFWYDDGLHLFSENQEIELIDLHARDELRVKGVGSQICSITVTTGHGYIRLKNYADFIGGTIEIGYGIITPIVEDMLIVAREGEYKVVLENGELTAQESVKLKRNQQITLDMRGYKMPKERIGYVRFDIEPYGADLYINGNRMDYSEPVKLNYGKHTIKVTMNGYDDFNGTLTIGESTPIISIRLAEGSYEVETDDSGGKNQTNNNTTIEKTPEEEQTQSEGNEDSEGGTTATDEAHTITVESPAGATLYLNGKKIGTVPVSFTKEIGTHVFVLSQSGYVTKSYSIEVLDDGENAVFNFPAMITSE